MGDMWDVGRKKLQDTFSSKKFLIIFGLFLLMSMASVYMGVQSYERQMEDFRQGSSYGPAPEKPSLIDVFEPMVSFNLPLTAGILALLLSYDSVSREREEGTIELLLSYPLYRDEVINGKFVAGLFTVAIALLISFMASTGLSVYLTGAIPGLQEVYRLMFLWQGSVVYMAFFFGLGTLCSVVFSTSRRSLIVSMLVLLLFVSTPFIAGIAANFIYPMDTGPQVQRGVTSGTASSDVVAEPDSRDSQEERRAEIRQNREAFQNSVEKVSPAGSYSNYVGIIMGTRYDSTSGVQPGIWESLESGLSYLVFLLSETVLVFAASYTVFMRQDL